MSSSSSKTKTKASSGFLRLLFCVGGIYGFFLTWGILQERISTMEYAPGEEGGVAGKFRYFQVLNLVQAVFAFIFAAVQIRQQRLPLIGATGHGHALTSQLLFFFFRIALCSAVGSSMGYRSLRHLNYPTMILGKSCKLVPVMLMNILIYRKHFETYKYATVALITAGVSGFMLFEDARGTGDQKVNSTIGLVLLLANLLLDGATNSWQDQLFLKYRLKSQQLMLFMNAFTAMLLFATLSAGVLDFNTWGLDYKSQALQAISFIQTHPSCLGDILGFSLCGALGQLFIFYTLEHFGSLVLVTVTVTRKLFTILLSLFWFRHSMNARQWMSVSLVFAALIMEASWKYISPRLFKGKIALAEDDNSGAVTPQKARIPVRPIDDEGKFLHVNKATGSAATEKSNLLRRTSPRKKTA